MGMVVAGLFVIVTFLLAQKSNQKRAPKTTAPRVYSEHFLLFLKDLMRIVSAANAPRLLECYLAIGSVY
jgi:hypothetical protein